MEAYFWKFKNKKETLLQKEQGGFLVLKWIMRSNSYHL